MKKNNILVESNSPYLIREHSYGYVVEEGKVDIFLTKIENDLPEGRRHFLFTANQGDIILGADFSKFEDEYGFLLSGLFGTKISKHSIKGFVTKYKDLVDEFIINISKYIPVNSSYLKKAKSIPIGEPTIVEEGTILKSADVIGWAEIKKGSASFINIDIPKGAIFPVSNIPIQTVKKSEIVFHSNEEFVKNSKKEDIISIFMNIYLEGIKSSIAFEKSNNSSLFKEKLLLGKSFISDSLSKFIDLFYPVKNVNISVGVGEPTLAAVKVVANYENINVIDPIIDDEYFKNPVDAISRSSKFMTRMIAFEDNWWTKDSGPIVAYYNNKDSVTPVALIPNSPTEYNMYNPQSKKLKLVDKKLASKINHSGYTLYRPFPNKKLTLYDIFMFSMKQKTYSDFLSILVIGAIVGALGMFTPIVTGMIFNNIIPGAEYNSLAYVTIFLISIAITGSIFEITRSVSTLRYEGKVDYMIQSAIWSRLLLLPVPFFKKYNSSDLSMRANSIITIRQMLTGAAMTTLLSSMFSIFQFGLLFYYDVKLALIAIVLTLIPAIVIFASAKIRLTLVRESTELGSKVANTMSQIISGISKFKIIGGEDRAFSLWSDKFYEQNDMDNKANTVLGKIGLFNSIYPIITTIVIFYFVSKNRSMNIGTFLAFQAAFSSFMGSLLSLSSTIVSTMEVIPLYERARPILEAIPEVTENKINPGALSGNVKVSNISYKYSEDGPTVLKNLSLDIKEGEFVALVGGSGSGKSTLVRLLLGFDEPLTGTIYYDSQDIKNIDIQMARIQMGVVLQNGDIMPGDIFSNIIGPYNLTLEDAWAAARAAGLDKDIEDMPMGMNTFIAEGAGTISGGQKQRILIARAIVNKPKIIFFDEATSALDNATQSIVTDSLNSFDATKIVVAHRLSTIIKAEKIFVFDKGEIVEQGSYEELMKKDGLFAELAKRQIA